MNEYYRDGLIIMERDTEKSRNSQKSSGKRSRDVGRGWTRVLVKRGRRLNRTLKYYSSPLKRLFKVLLSTGKEWSSADQSFKISHLSGRYADSSRIKG